VHTPLVTEDVPTGSGAVFCSTHPSDGEDCLTADGRDGRDCLVGPVCEEGVCGGGGGVATSGSIVIIIFICRKCHGI
jgi:hypothetical protein